MNKQVISKPASINFFSYVGDTQGCGTIRIIYPHLLLPHIRMEGYRFSGFYSAYFIRQGDYYKHFTAIIFQRAATRQHLALISDFINKVSKPTNTPIIYEIDDLLIDIPQWNYAHKYYKENEEYIKQMMSIVHGLTVSTEKLKEVYSKYNPHIEVVPNHLPKFIWGDIVPKHERQPRETKPRILWAGSENHFAVAQMGLRGGDFGDGLLNYIRKTIDKYQWVLCGGKPQELSDLIQNKKIEYHGWRNIFEYPMFLKSLDVDLAVAPLMPCLFNECKSNIKMLEYTALGIPAVYSKIEPYKKASLQGSSDGEIIDHIERLVNDLDLRKNTWKLDYETLKDQLWWEDNNFKNVKQYINASLGLFNKKIPF